MKTFCILEQGHLINEPLTLAKKTAFTTDFSDFYRLNWKQDGDLNAFITKKHIVYSEGRSLLYDKIPKQYEYYIFTDDDVIFSVPQGGSIAEKIRDLLNECKPMAGTFYDPNSWYLNQKQVNQDECLAKKYFPIRGHDMQVQILSHPFAAVMMPISYHGSDISMWPVQWACHQLFPLKQICFTEVQVNNSRNKSKKKQKQMIQFIAPQYTMLLFNADIKKSCQKMEWQQQIIAKNMKCYEQKIDKAYYAFCLGDLAKIYDVDNFFYRNRKPTANWLLTWLIRIRIALHPLWILKANKHHWARLRVILKKAFPER